MVQRVTVAGLGGEYVFDGLPEGLYRVCAELPGSRYLDPCEWDNKPPTVRVDGKGVNKLNLQMERGAVVLIRVEDTDGQGLDASQVKAGVKNGKGNVLAGKEQAPRGRSGG